MKRIILLLLVFLWGFVAIYAQYLGGESSDLESAIQCSLKLWIEENMPETDEKILINDDNLPWSYDINYDEKLNRECYFFSTSRNRQYDDGYGDTLLEFRIILFLDVRLVGNKLTVSIEQRKVHLNRAGYLEFETVSYKTYLYEYSCWYYSWEYRLCVDIYPQFKVQRETTD